MNERHDHGGWSTAGLFARASAIVIANPAATLIPALLVGTLPGSVLGYALNEWGQEPAGDPGLAVVIGMTVGWIGFGIVLDVLLQGVAAPVAIAHAQDRRIGLGAVLPPLIARLPALLVLSLIVGAATAVGFALLVPGLVLYAVWSVAGAAAAAEGSGPIAALRRSWRLTRGARLKVAGFRVLITGLYLGWVIVSGLVALVVFQGTDALTTSTSEPYPLAYFLISAVPQTLVLAWWGAAHGQLYVELREAADGPSPDRLAAIFA